LDPPVCSFPRRREITSGKRSSAPRHGVCPIGRTSVEPGYGRFCTGEPRWKRCIKVVPLGQLRCSATHVDFALANHQRSAASKLSHWDDFSAALLTAIDQWKIDRCRAALKLSHWDNFGAALPRQVTTGKSADAGLHQSCPTGTTSVQRFEGACEMENPPSQPAPNFLRSPQSLDLGARCLVERAWRLDFGARCLVERACRMDDHRKKVG